MSNENRTAVKGVHLRINSKGLPFWQVKVARVKRCFQKRFYCHDHEGEEAALKVALQWLAEINQIHPVKTPLEKVRRLHPRNTSGRAGVCRCSTVKRRTGKTTVFWYWRAFDPGNHRHTKSFLISRYGEEDAYRLAVNTRAAFEAEYARRKA